MVQFLLLIVGGLILFIAGVGYTLRRLNLGKTSREGSGDGGLVGWILVLIVMAGILHFLISPNFRATELLDSLKSSIEQQDDLEEKKKSGLSEVKSPSKPSNKNDDLAPLGTPYK
jgi:nitrate reductase gamma subunit